MKIAGVGCFCGRNVGVHGQIPFSFESFGVVLGANRSVLSKFPFGGRVRERVGGGSCRGRSVAGAPGALGSQSGGGGEEARGFGDRWRLGNSVGASGDRLGLGSLLGVLGSLRVLGPRGMPG